MENTYSKIFIGLAFVFCFSALYVAMTFPVHIATGIIVVITLIAAVACGYEGFNTLDKNEQKENYAKP